MKENTAQNLDSFIKRIAGIEKPDLIKEILMTKSEDIIFAIDYWEGKRNAIPLEINKAECNVQIARLEKIMKKRTELTCDTFDIAFGESIDQADIDAKAEEEVNTVFSDKEDKPTLSIVDGGEVKDKPELSEINKKCRELLRKGKREESFQHASIYLSNGNYTPKPGKKVRCWKESEINRWLKDLREGVHEETHGIEDAKVVEEQEKITSKEKVQILLEHFPEAQYEMDPDGKKAMNFFSTPQENEQQRFDDLALKLKELYKNGENGKMHADVLIELFFENRDYEDAQIHAWVDQVKNDKGFATALYDKEKVIDHEAILNSSSQETGVIVPNFDELVNMVEKVAELDSSGNPVGSIPDLMKDSRVKSLIGKEFKNAKGEVISIIKSDKQLGEYIGRLFNDQVNTNRTKAGKEETVLTYPYESFLALIQQAQKATWSQEKFLTKNIDKLVEGSSFKSLVNSKGEVIVEINSQEDIRKFVQKTYVQNADFSEGKKNFTDVPKRETRERHDPEDGPTVEDFKEFKPKGDELISKGWNWSEILAWAKHNLLKKPLKEEGKVPDGQKFLFVTEEAVEGATRGSFPGLYSEDNKENNNESTQDIQQHIREYLEKKKDKTTAMGAVMEAKKYAAQRKYDYSLKDIRSIVKEVVIEIIPEKWGEYEERRKEHRDLTKSNEVQLNKEHLEKVKKEEKEDDTIEADESPFSVRHKEIWEKYNLSTNTLDDLKKACKELIEEGNNQIVLNEFVWAMIADEGKIKGTSQWDDEAIDDWFETEVLNAEPIDKHPTSKTGEPVATVSEDVENASTEQEIVAQETNSESLSSENTSKEVNPQEEESTSKEDVSDNEDSPIDINNLKDYISKEVTNPKNMRKALFEILKNNEDTPVLRKQLIATFKSLTGNKFFKKFSRKTEAEFINMIENTLTNVKTVRKAEGLLKA